MTRRAESDGATCDRCIDFVAPWKIVPQKVVASALVTDEPIDAINASFDQTQIEAHARAWNP